MDNGLKSKGNEKYKTGGAEPINLFRDGGMIHDFALANIIKYAFRNRREVWPQNYTKARQDMNKIIHYAETVKSLIPLPEEEEYRQPPGVIIPNSGRK